MNSTRWVPSAALLSSLVFAATGCKKDSTAAAAEPRPLEEVPGMKATAEPPATSPGATEPAASPAAATQPAADDGRDVVALGAGGKSKVVAVGGKTVADTPSYRITLAAPGKLGKGAQGTVSLEVVPKPGWKLNKEFPTKLTVNEPAGVKVQKKEQTVADAVAFAEKSGRWSVEFQADSAGDKAFTALFKFAVCTDTSCDPKKEQLAWNVAVGE
jgi:hypothetical protein